MCCLVRNIKHLRRVWSSGEIMISKGKLKDVEDRSASVTLRPPRIAREVTGATGRGTIQMSMFVKEMGMKKNMGNISK
jgi:hypothetical protein